MANDAKRNVKNIKSYSLNGMATKAIITATKSN